MTVMVIVPSSALTIKLMKTQIRHLFVALALLSTLILQPSTVFAQGTTAFTYQGQLRDGGTNANGAYTMIFKLYDAVTSGNQIGAAITNSPTLFNGLFSVNLDFGAGAFNGIARWLDITVSNGVVQTLSPRVQVLPAPYALYAAVAATVTNGAIMNAQMAANAVNANNIASDQVVKSLDGLADAVSLTAGTNVILTTNGNILQISASGGGGGVTVTNKLAAGNNVGLFTNGGVVQISSFVPNIQGFRTSGTFVVPTNVTRIMVEMWGAGGGGGTGNINGYVGGGGGAGAYAWNVFTVTPGSSYSVTVPSSPGPGGNGGGASFSGNSISMSAGGGFAGGNATSSSNGTGGVGGTASGSIVNVQGTGGNNNGNGGGVWRGGGISPIGGQTAIGGGLGPGGGGRGGGPGNTGDDGNSGVVIVYY